MPKGQGKSCLSELVSSLSAYIVRVLQVFRATSGKALVWGKKPKIIIAKYKTGDGKEAQSLLLASGVVLLLPQHTRNHSCLLESSRRLPRACSPDGGDVT